MSDTRSKAAEEWMRSQVMRIWTDDILPEIESAHLADHEHMAAIKDAEIAALRERLATYQRAVLWCYGWMMDGMTAKFAKAIDDDEKYRKVKSLVGEASDEVEP